MKIQRADKTGYCFGVNNAISKADELVSSDTPKPLYMLGDLTHNAQEMQRLKDQGFVIKNSVEDINDGTVIIRAHGIPKDDYNKLINKGITVIDGTCPFVKNVHKKVERYSKEGYQIIIVGDPNHPEIIGVSGWAENKPIVISTIEEAQKLERYDKICIVAQTTLIEEKFNKITEELKSKTNDILIFNTICSATEERQNAAVDLAKRVEGMIVVGGYHSSNTQKLKELCDSHCKNTWLIETPQELDIEALKKLNSIGLTAGASTPEWLIKEVTEKMEENMVDQTVVTDESTQPEVEVQSAETKPEEQVESVEQEVVAQEPETADEKQVTAEENAAADEEFDFAAEIDNLKPIHKNSVIEGDVIRVTEDEVLVNIGYKSDAVIFKRDFTWKRDEDLRDLVKEGDKVSAIVTDLNDGEGRVKLSKIKYDNQQIQSRLGKAFENREVLYGKVDSVSGSGLMVDVGFAEIFMPASQYHLHFVKDLNSLIGNDVRGILIDYNPKRRRAILSQKVLLAEERDERLREQQAKKENRFNELEVDDVVTGRVKTITDFGVFVDLNGIDGFIHRSDLTWDRNNEPKKLAQRGQEIEAKVISKNDEEKKLKLSVKALQEKPWEKFVKSYAENDEIEVLITNTLPFGAFAQIIPGVEGLIHISEISYDRVDSVDSELKSGDTAKVKIIKIDDDQEKISLSIKATLPRPERIQKTKEESDYEFEEYGSEGRRDNRRKRNRRQNNNNNRNNVFYEDTSEFTLGDTFGSLFDGLDFGEDIED